MGDGINMGLLIAMIKQASGADPEQIEQFVKNWLNEHPEATTTVQDGSITLAKLAADLAAKINSITQLSDEIDGIDSDVTDLKSALTTETARAKAEEARIEALFTQPVEEAVSDWLDDHPEATTTVQDGSLTYEKLVTGTLGFVTPEMFGATGDGETDDTEALQATFNSGYDVLLLNEYVIKERLDISKQIKIEGGKLIADFIGICLNITSDNVVIDGLEIDGGNKAYCGIGLNQVANTIIKNCTIHHFSATTEQNAYGINTYKCDNTRIENCKVYDISANQNNTNICAGIDVTNSTNTIINACEIYNITCVASGSHDADGIHIIDDNKITKDNYRDYDTIISSCIFGTCTKRMIKIQQSGVIVENCLIKEDACKDNRGNSGIACYYNDIIIRNCNLFGNVQNAIIVGAINSVFPDNDAIMKNITIDGCYIVAKGTSYQAGITILNNTMQNIRITNNRIVCDGVNEEGISIRTSINNLLIANNYFYTQGAYAYCISTFTNANLKSAQNIVVLGNIGQSKVSLLLLQGGINYKNVSVSSNVLENTRDSQIESKRAKLIVVQGNGTTTENIKTGTNVYPSYFSEITS